MENRILNNEELENISGGMPNPVTGISYKDAMKKAMELGNGTDMGSWQTMNAQQYLTWWRASNLDSKEYLDNKDKIDGFIG